MMNPTSDQHDRDHEDLVFMYAVQALPADEAVVVEQRITACAGCRQEMETLRPVVDSLSAWPTDVLRPSTSLWARLAARVAKAGAAVGRSQPLAGPAPSRWEEPDWNEAAPGIFVKLLATDADNSRVSMLVRLAPGTEYPPHRHAGVEELHLLDGELMIDDRTLYPGDYNRGGAGSIDRRVWSETGCTCVLVTSYHDVILRDSAPPAS
jgi:anti-sigma factor ChrR (cupin superfamily)